MHSTANSAAVFPTRSLAELVIALRDEDHLCIVEGERETREPQIICSMGLAATGETNTNEH